ncbi:MAG: YraN family protein [Lachnospiraceae bacterium]|nr:YraN family protein [Lachnospiraceae bacterium]
MTNKRELGAAMEQRMREYLEEHGFNIIAMNYRCKLGEVDIIAKDEEYLCFVEVKYRKDESLGFPEEAVDIRKQKTICNVARHYMYCHRLNEFTPVRFDVAAILGEEIRYRKNAFMWAY